MEDVIKDKLQAIAAEKQIDILYACESGSRGWQFASPDSDYDVRFIYARPLSAYLSIKEYPDSMSFPITDELDIYGWDIRKVLMLMRRSNVTPFEWLQSPVIYAEEPGFRDRLWSISPQYFCVRTNVLHYIGIARGAWGMLSSESTIGIKKLFYVLRPLLAAEWCLRYNTIAPMTIGPLLTLVPDELTCQITDLIALKAGKVEAYAVTISKELASYIDTRLAECPESVTHLPKKLFDTTAMDLLFLEIIEAR